MNYSAEEGRVGAGDVSCAMAIIPVKVKLKNRPHTVETYAFFDSGSSVSFCTEHVMKQLGGSGKKTQVTLNTMGNPYKMNTYALNGLQVCDLDMENVVSLPKVYTKEEMPVSQHHIPKHEEISKWSHLSDISIPNIDANIGIMLGNNVPDAYTPFEVLIGPSGSPHATRTRLGWIVWNIIRDDASQLDVNRAERVIDDKRENSVEDEHFLRQVEESVHFENGHYCIALPFRDRNVKLPNNNVQGTQRLKGLKNKLVKNHKFRSDYVNFMDNLLSKGYAEPVPDDQLERNDGRVWYLPHHGVYHPKKPDKIRVVFDCSASYMGVSLNSQLLQGPDLANKLLGVLIRFREEKVAVVGDVEAMFHQVIVPPSDRDCLRFFWWPDGNLDKEPKMYRMVSHLFGATSSPSCCNFALKCTAEEKGHQFEPIITETIKRNMYVDDCLTSTVSDEKAKALINDLSALCQEGGFRLTKWTSNSAAVLEAIPEENRATSKQRNLESDSPVERALGVHWFTEKDTLGFQINVKDQPPTRRGILSMVSSVYDPLGIASPFILTAKSILQNLCKQGIRWDDDITDTDLRKWNTWISQLHELENVEVERCYKPSDFGNVTSVQLHSFSDASDTGLGMVFYLRFIDETGRIHCSFLLGKSRVAPLKTVTVPRMELTAASSSVKLCKMIKEELGFPINETFYWTDSTSVLRYIANKNARFHTFVANRVSVIHEATEENQWRYVNTKENPADCASRGLSIGKFRQNPQWINGPDFLWKSESEWPEYQLDKTIENDDAEVKRVVNTASLDKTNSCEGMDRLLTRFSDYTKLKRITAWMLTAIGNLKAAVQRTKDITDRIKSSESNTRNREKMMETAILADRQSRLAEAPKRVKSLFLTSDALNRSEMALARYVQRTDFQEEFESLQRCGKVNKSSKLRDLDPYIDNGLLRVGGRLERADMSFDAKHPIILPKESRMSQLLIEDVHRSVGHLGKNSILTVLRQRYWIIRANASIKRVVSRCVICRKYQAPCSRQKMANLPRERLVPDEPPFTKVGMDFFGPLETKRGS
ncbi:uncharacterized protein [Argopecten irradians]|uniref:uncharacterized protein n=1 Tax=Argopecten irradians TaxID=31199 RepID=UPI0037184966